MSKETIRHLKQTGVPVARAVEAKAGPPPGSLSELLRLDAQTSPDDVGVWIDLPTFAARVFRADWMEKRIMRMEEALLRLAEECEDRGMADLADLARMARDAVRTDWHRMELEKAKGEVSP